MSEEFEPMQNEQGVQDPYQQGVQDPYQQPVQNPYQQAGQNGTAPVKEKKKKGSSVMDIIATIVAVVIFRLFGLVGGLICYGCYWAVRAVVKSKMGVAAKVILSIVLILVFIVLFFAFAIFVAMMME